MQRRAVLVTASIGVASVLLGSTFAYVLSEAALQRDFSVSAKALDLRVEPTPLLVDRGRHIATALAQCQFCHGPDLAGVRVIEAPWIGRLYAANLTKGNGGVGQTYAVADWVRAVRFGVRPDGRSLLLHPAEHLSRMSDSDLAAVISYLRQVPAVESHHPDRKIGALIRIGLALGLVPDLLSAPAVDRTRRQPIDVPAERSVAYGAYLTDIGNCRFCHRADLSGGLHPLARSGEPSPADLRPEGAMAAWNREDFARAMRDGRTPDGRLLDAGFMPSRGFADLRALEIDSLWLYLKTR